MAPPDSDASPTPHGENSGFEQARDDFLLDKSKQDESGSYRRNLEREINRFHSWYTTEFNATPRFGELDPTVFRRYARHLVRQDWTDGTVLNYYGQISAFTGWCVREGYLDDHHAQAAKATEPLPEDEGRRSGDQQAWGPTERRAIIQHVDEQARVTVESIDEAGTWPAVRALRNRALVAVLCYTGVRAGEILARGDDARRNGITWEDVDLDEGRMTVLSKKQEWDDRSLPKQTVHPLEMLYRVLQPDDDWPVFVTLSYSDVFPPVREALETEGLRDAEIDTRVGKETLWELYRECDATPPALQTNGGREIMKRLTDEAGIDVSQGDYLQPHGGRRGAGEVMVRTNGYAAAARLLDNTEEMVRERYSHIEAGELADAAAKAFATVDANEADERPSESDQSDIPDSYR
jgi:integrase